MSGSKELGDFGERVACFYLKNKGYKILERNYFENWSHGTRKGEIDIIAGKEGRQNLAPSILKTKLIFINKGR